MKCQDLEGKRCRSTVSVLQRSEEVESSCTVKKRSLEEMFRDEVEAETRHSGMTDLWQGGRK